MKILHSTFTQIKESNSSKEGILSLFKEVVVTKIFVQSTIF